MLLTRRSLLGTGLGIVASAGVRREAGASEQGGGQEGGGDAQELGQGFSEDGPISYIPVKQVMIATRLLVVSRDALYATGLDSIVRARDEDKINLGEIPLIGGLAEDSGFFPDLLTREDFAPANRIGTAYGAGKSLLVDLSQPERSVSEIVDAVMAGDDDLTAPRQVLIEAKLIQTVVVANGGYSFHVGGHNLRRTDPKSQVPVLGDLPILGQLFRVGEAYRRESNLLILIKPTVLFPEED